MKIQANARSSGLSPLCSKPPEVQGPPSSAWGRYRRLAMTAERSWLPQRGGVEVAKAHS